jgi:hypothetical protein
MPCLSCEGMGDAYREDPVARRDIEKLRTQLGVLETVLCTAVRAVGIDELIAKGDWSEAGIKADSVRDWWDQHEKADAARRKEEARVAELNRRRAEALAKLSPDEREALGIAQPSNRV